MLDIHTHVLPHTDDGAANMEMTRAMLRSAAKLGLRHVIATPHMRVGDDIALQQRLFSETREVARAEGVSLYAGCELRYDALLLHLEDPSPFWLGKEGFLLVEMSSQSLPLQWFATLEQLAGRGLHVIIAHPERYRYIQGDLAMARDMIQAGCEMQVDAGGLYARDSAERKTARALLAQGLVAYIASDAHEPSHYRVMRRAMRSFRDEWPMEGRLAKALE